MSTLTLPTARPARTVTDPDEANRAATEIPVERGGAPLHRTRVASSAGDVPPVRSAALAPRGLEGPDPDTPASDARCLATRGPVAGTLAPRGLDALALSVDDPDLGASTAEYAVIVLAAAAFGGVMAAVLSSDSVSGLLLGMIQKALSF